MSLVGFEPKAEQLTRRKVRTCEYRPATGRNLVDEVGNIRVTEEAIVQVGAFQNEVNQGVEGMPHEEDAYLGRCISWKKGKRGGVCCCQDSDSRAQRQYGRRADERGGLAVHFAGSMRVLMHWEDDARCKLTRTLGCQALWPIFVHSGPVKTGMRRAQEKCILVHLLPSQFISSSLHTPIQAAFKSSEVSCSSLCSHPVRETSAQEDTLQWIANQETSRQPGTWTRCAPSDERTIFLDPSLRRRTPSSEPRATCVWCIGTDAAWNRAKRVHPAVICLRGASFASRLSQANLNRGGRLGGGGWQRPLPSMVGWARIR